MVAALRNPSRPPSRPATFAPNPHRRAMIAKIKIAQKELGLEDEDYRAVLQRVTGKTSAGDLNEAQLEAVIDEFKAKGWKPTIASSGAGRPRPQLADHPAAKKARALWLSLAQLGVVENGNEEALRAFARRQLGTELAWADQGRVYRLIEALKAMAERAGWSQDLAGIAEPRQVMELKLRLAELLRANLAAAGVYPAEAGLEEVAYMDKLWLGGMTRNHWTVQGVDQLVSHLAAAWAKARVSQ